MAALLVAAGVAACGHTAPSQRAQVARYLKQVQRIETASTKPLKAVTQAGVAFGAELRSGPDRPVAQALTTDEASLVTAQATLRSLRAKLAATRAPAVAGRLRRLLLELSSRQITLSAELHGLMTFLPRFNRALTTVGPAIERLQRVLGQGGSYSGSEVTAVYDRKADALRGFAASATAIVAHLEQLDPPAVARAGYETQLASLRGMTRAADRLATALARQESAAVSSQLLAFDRAATLSRTLGAQRAQIDAIRSYDRSVTAVTKLVTAVDQERYQLNSTLPQG